MSTHASADHSPCSRRSFLASAASRKRRGFTLIEVMVAALIISLLVMTIYRFLSANLTAIRISTEVTSTREELNGLVSFLQTLLEDLPQKQQGVLIGNPNKIHDLASDEMQWVCRAGHGLLTMSAPDEYRVTLAIQPVEKTSSELEIGLRRQLSTSDEHTYNWLSLIRPAAALEIRYFDPRLNAWIDRWSDINVRPSLVRFRIWRTADQPPLEAILPVPSSTTTPQIQNFQPTQPGQPIPGVNPATGQRPASPTGQPRAQPLRQ